jgi:hypothetical protein
MAERRWRIRLGAAAELDFANIVKGPPRILARGNRASVATRSFRPFASLLMARFCGLEGPEIVRILRDGMDLQRQAPFTLDREG